MYGNTKDIIEQFLEFLMKSHNSIVNHIGEFSIACVFRYYYYISPNPLSSCSGMIDRKLRSSSGSS